MTTNDYAEPSADLLDGRMPLLGFGTWQISNTAAAEVTAHALQSGYRHIDTATVYRNEAGIGKALAASRLARESVFVTTKLPPDRAGREHRTLEESLAKLGLDYVDLWLIHWPPNGRAAPRVWEQFVKARQDGLARAIGVSNYSLRQIDELIEVTGVVPEVNQKSARRDRIVTNAAGARIRLTAEEVTAIDGLSRVASGSSRRFG